MNRAVYENQYTRKKILDFLAQNGYRVNADEQDVEIDDSLSEKQLKRMALGIPDKTISRANATKPALYLWTNIVSVLGVVVGLILLFVDPYMNYINLSSMPYIVWCLCCMSMYFTNKIAVKDWKKRHGQERKK